MSFRNTAVLAVLVALLGAYLYWVERPALEEEARRTRVLEFTPAEINRLELTSKGETIRAEKRDGSWDITAPVDGPADSQAVEALVRTAAEAEQSRAIETDAADLAAFGLAEPETELRLYGASGPVPALAIGKGTPIGFNAYVRRGDEEVVLMTSGTVRAALMKTLADLRDKTILELDQSDVDTIAIRPRGGDTVRLERTGDGWVLTSPLQAPASETAVGNLFSALAALRAVDFLAETGAEAEASRGLTPPRVELELTGSQSPVVLRLGNEVDLGDKQLVAATLAGQSQIYLVASHVPASLGRSSVDLRDKTVLPIDEPDVHEMRVVHRDGDAFTLVRSEAGWTASDGGEIDSLLAKRLVDDVLGLEGDGVASEAADLAAVGIPEAGLRIDVLDAAGAPLGAIDIAQATRDGTTTHYAVRRGHGPVYTLRDYVFSRVTKSRADLMPAN